MASLTSLASSIVGSLEEHRSDLMLTGLSRQGDAPEETFVFQYFPETLSDTKAINIQKKEIPGGTLPLHQWINSGERNLTFTAVFTSDVDLLAKGIAKAPEIFGRVKSAGIQRWNIDVRTAVAYLRTFLFPTYGGQSTQGTPYTFAPRKVRLCIPRSGIGLNGGMGANTVSPDSVICVMTQCEITYQKFFASGLPRIVEVSLAFSQIPQRNGVVEFPQSAMGALPSVGGGGARNSVLDLSAALGNLTGGILGGAPSGVTEGGMQPYSIEPRNRE